MDGYFSWSSKVLPAPSLTADTTATVKLVDPLLYNLSTFFAQLLNTNLQPRFSNETNHCSLTHSNLDNWVDGYAVAQITDFPLNSLSLKENDFKFPMLNVCVESEEPHQLTLTNVSVKRDFCVNWILPPLTTRQYNRIYHFLGEASKIWIGYGQQGYDPKINLNSVWKDCEVSFGSLNSIDYQHFSGFDKAGKEANFPAMQFRLSFWERNRNPVPQNFETFTGISLLEEDLYDGYNIANPIEHFIDGYINPDIILTQCTPNSGSIQGNTLLVVQGSGFLSQKFLLPSQLTICGTIAKQVVVKSPTVLMVITNPGIQTGTGNIVFTDLQGNQYTLANGYTYT